MQRIMHCMHAADTRTIVIAEFGQPDSTLPKGNQYSLHASMMWLSQLLCKGLQHTGSAITNKS